MDRFYPKQAFHGDRGIKVTFVSKRLRDLIMKKTIEGKWIISYFEINPVIKLNRSFLGTAMNTNGLIIATKEY